VNLRAFIAAIYTLMFLWALIDIVEVGQYLTAEMAPLVFRGLFVTFGGALLAYWLYTDEETIDSLRGEITSLRLNLSSLEKKLNQKA